MVEAVTPLSSWFLGEHHRRLGSGSPEPVRLALALNAVRSVVRIIDDTVPPLVVEWAAEGEHEGKSFSMSYTDFKASHIRISPLPITERKLVTGAALDVCTGFALHEANHSKRSRRAFATLLDLAQKEDPRATPLRVASWLMNLAEDVRIEAESNKEWPGFADYYQVVKDYMWSGQPITSYGPKVADKMKLIYIACRYPERIVPGFLGKKKELAAEVAWWQAWQHDYLSGITDVATTIGRGIEHLGEDEKTRDEMQVMAGQEKAQREAGERLRQQLERLMQEGIEGAPMVCITDAGEIVPLDARTAAAVDALVREELIETKTKIRPNPGDGFRLPIVRVRRPEETPQSKRAYVGRPDATAQALRASLVFRASAAEHTSKLLDRGDLDEDELHRWPLGDYRLFKEHNIESRPDVFMGLLVDMSGSMNDGYKLPIAQRLAQLFVWALHDQPGVRTGVWGHTADRPEGADIFRLWETGDPLSRLGIISTEYHGNNYDSIAVEWVARRILEQPEPQKLLVVLSDGLPSASGYGGQPAMAHVRQVTDWAERQGCPVVQIAIDESLRMADQEAMFRHVIPYQGEAALPRQLARLMGRWTT